MLIITNAGTTEASISLMMFKGHASFKQSLQMLHKPTVGTRHLQRAVRPNVSPHHRMQWTETQEKTSVLVFFHKLFI